MKPKIGDKVILNDYFRSGPTIGTIYNIEKSAMVYWLSCENGKIAALNDSYFNYGLAQIIGRENDNKNYCKKCAAIIPPNRLVCCGCKNR